MHPPERYRSSAVEHAISDLRPPTSGFGALHDASEIARFGIPTVTMFVQSLHGISHNKIEDTKVEHLESAVTAFDKLADKALRWIESGHRRTA